MFAKNLISDIVPALLMSDTGLKALSWMEVFRVSHLPIIRNEELLGVISDTDIFDHNMAEEALDSHQFSLYCPFVYENQHIYEVIELASRMKLSVIPVLDQQKKYLGAITLHDLVQYFSELTSLKQPGAIIILEMNTHSYSLTQIANIVESNDAKILSLYINAPTDSTRLFVTIKVNKTDIHAIQQTFYRYDYDIVASFMEDEDSKRLLEERYESFMTFMNV